MRKYHLPTGMRYTSLEEREQFYRLEFNVRKVNEWINNKAGRTKYAVIIGRHTKIYPKKYREDAETTIIVDEYCGMEEVREQILEFLPEGVYYDRNVYDENDLSVGQELAFDLDPENIPCPIHGTLEDKMKRLQGLSFCEIELDMVKKEALGLCEFLENRFSDLKVVYSGRGFHLHVFDSEAFSLGIKERLNLAQQVKRKGFHIDEWVTSGEHRLIRLPFSLNGIVSRVVLPIKKDELEGFDAVHDRRCLPRFLEGKEPIF